MENAVVQPIFGINDNNVILVFQAFKIPYLESRSKPALIGSQLTEGRYCRC